MTPFCKKKTSSTYHPKGFCLLVGGNTGYHKKSNDKNGSDRPRDHLFSTLIPLYLFPRHYLETLEHDAAAVAGERKKDSFKKSLLEDCLELPPTE